MYALGEQTEVQFMIMIHYNYYIIMFLMLFIYLIKNIS